MKFMTTFCCHPLKSYSSFHLASTIAAKTMCQGNTLHNQYMQLHSLELNRGVVVTSTGLPIVHHEASQAVLGADGPTIFFSLSELGK